ncbi:MAG: hypothetical protein Rubg2KO_04580 [Rubricoccaceae bacterium]
MTRVYSNPDPAIAHLVRNAIDEIGVPVVVKGDGTVTLTEVPNAAAWAEVWVSADGDRMDEVLALVRDVTEDAPSSTEPWTCPSCGEIVDGTFAVCWSCGAEAPTDASS